MRELKGLDKKRLTYVHDMDDYVNIINAAWPTRFYLVGLGGHVVYAGGLRPYSIMKPK